MRPEFLKLFSLLILLLLIRSAISAGQSAPIQARATVADPIGFEIAEMEDAGRNTHIEISCRYALVGDMVYQIIIENSISGESVIIYGNPRDISYNSTFIAFDIVQPGAENCTITIIDISD